MVSVKNPHMVKLYGVKNGVLQYACSCGRLATEPMKKFNKYTRCAVCQEADKKLHNKGEFITVEEEKKLFSVMLKNGLYNYVSNIALKRVTISDGRDHPSTNAHHSVLSKV